MDREAPGARPPVIWSGLRTWWRATPAVLADHGGADAPVADAVILDMAIGPVPDGPLEPACLAARRLARRAVIARVSPLGAGRFEADIAGCAPAHPDAVLLPGCADGRDIQHCGVKLAVAEAALGRAAGALAVLAAPDPAGLLRLDTFVSASPRLAGLVLDLEAPDAGTGPTARALLLLAGRAAAVPCFAALDDLAGDPLLDRVRALRADGFAGVVLRHADCLAAIEAAGLSS